MRTRTTLVIALGIAGLLAAPASAAGVRYRQVKAEYAQPGGVTGVIKGSTFVNGERYGSALIPVKRGEYAIDVTVVDANGAPVAFALGHDSGDAQKKDTPIGGEYCGSTPRALRLAKPGHAVTVYVLAGTCGSGVSAPTEGVVTARLHSRR